MLERPSRWALRFVLIAAPLSAAPAGAQTVYQVPKSFTIQQAFAAAQAGDQIQIADTGSPYVLGTGLVLADGVTCLGGFDSTYVFPDPANHQTVLALAADSTGSILDVSQAASTATVLAGFTIGPSSKPPTWTTVNGAGVFVGTGTLEIRNCIFRNNVSRDAGGALQIGVGSSVQVRDCTFTNNETGLIAGGGRGAAIAVATGSNGVLIEHCTFVNNVSDAAQMTTSASGGAVFTRSGIRIERCTFQGNSCGHNGGALYVANADVRAWGNLFYNNTAGRDGGAIFHENGAGSHAGTLIEDCTAGAAGVGSGGAIYFQSGANRFLDGYLRRNTALAGDGFTSGVGGAFYFFEPLQGSAVRGCELTGNRALVGGAIAVQGTVTRSFSDVQISGNTIAGNFASIADVSRYGGGGLHFFDDFIGEVVNNIIAMQEDGCGITCEGPLASPNIRYNCVWNDPATNPDPMYGENCTDRTNINGNIAQNPVFCCLTGGCLPVGNPPPDVQLGFGSPCLGSGEGGVDMGAYPGATNCATPVSLEPASWGKIKSLYR